MKPNALDSSGKASVTYLVPESDLEEEGLNLVAYWRILKRNIRGIFGIAFLGMIIGILSALSIAPSYRSKATLQVNPLQPDIGFSDLRSDTSVISLFYETQHEIIRSRAVASLVVDKLNLVEQRQAQPNPAEDNATHDSKSPLDMLSEILIAIKELFNWHTWFSESPRPEPDVADLRNRLIDEIQNGLEVSRGKQSEIVNVSYQAADPKLAAAVANAVADAYIEFGLTSRISGVKSTAGWLNTQLNELQAKVKESEAVLKAHQQKLGMVDTANHQRLASERLSSLTAELMRVQTARIESQIRHQQARSLKGRAGGGTQSLGDLLKSPTVLSLSKEENEVARKVQELSERYGEKHPKMIAARSDLREARRSLQREVDKVVDSIRKEYKLAAAKEKEIRSLIKTQKEEISGLADASFELTQLEREVENNRKLYLSLLDKFKEANVAEEYDASNVRVVDRATVPSKAFKPNKRRMIMTAGILGLFLGILVAFLRERLNNTFRSTDDIEKKLGIPSLGIVPMVRKSKKAGPPEWRFMDSPHCSFTENINKIRTGLLFSNRPPKSILITSAISGEGKTVLSINLAAALSQVGRTVLLEADLRKSTITNLLGIKSQPGLAELVANQATLKEVLGSIGLDKRLFVLPCVLPPSNPLQLLSSRNFKFLLDELRQNFAHVVMDAPPMLAVSDASVLGHFADSVILAIKAESTTHEMSGEALSLLQKSGVQVLGAVLCQLDTHRIGYYDYYEASYPHEKEDTASDRVNVSQAKTTTTGRYPRPRSAPAGGADRDHRAHPEVAWNGSRGRGHAPGTRRAVLDSVL